MTRDFKVFQERVEVDYNAVIEQLPLNENKSFIEKGYQITICDLAYKIFNTDLKDCDFDVMVLLYYDKPVTAFYEFYVNNQGNLANGCMSELDGFIMHARQCVSEISITENTSQDMCNLHKRYIEFISNLS